MLDKFSLMPNVKAYVDLGGAVGTVDFRGHSVGIGGVNPLPMNDCMVEATALLNPGMIRIFIQEFFFIERESGELDFTVLDRYMEAVGATGAAVMASICIKPRSLYPVVDEEVWRPGDVGRWQFIIGEMVRRYSVEKKLVTHWGVGNEINIGEAGGCPYKIGSARDYFEYYAMTVRPILEVFPGARVGGPSWAGAPGGGNAGEAFFGEFVRLCAGASVPLDFICYNVYSDDPASHVRGALSAKSILDACGSGAEIYVTELNIGIGNEISVEEKAHSAKRAAGLGAILYELNRGARFLKTFQYHLYDQYCDPNDFRPFFKRHRYMANHWNDEPHRLGLLDSNGLPRPQYFLYAMLYSMAENEADANIEENVKNLDEKGALVAEGGANSTGSGAAGGDTAGSDDAGGDDAGGDDAGGAHNNVRLLASLNDKLIIVFVVNYDMESSQDVTMSLYLKDAREGMAKLEVYRIDDNAIIDMMRWNGVIEQSGSAGLCDVAGQSGDSELCGGAGRGGGLLGLGAVEDRAVYVHDDFWFSIYVPADSATMVRIEYEDINV